MLAGVGGRCKLAGARRVRHVDRLADDIERADLGMIDLGCKAEVLDPFGQPVPGLYAAGRNAFGVSAQQYPGSGASVGDGLTFGRIAGSNVAALEPWS